MPDRKNDYERRMGYRTRFYKDDYFITRGLRKFLDQQIAERIAPGMTVGDIGCGEQPLRKAVVDRGARYIGIDITQNAQGTVDVVADITNVPLAPQSLDVILCTEVLEHVSDTYGAFRELGRLLKPGGQLVITTPFSYQLHEEPYDFVRLTPYQIAECAKLNNFIVRELDTSGNELEVLATLIDCMWRRMIDGKPNFFQRKFLLASRILVNTWVGIGNKVIGRGLAKKYYLNVLCVLEQEPAPVAALASSGY